MCSVMIGVTTRVKNKKHAKGRTHKAALRALRLNSPGFHENGKKRAGNIKGTRAKAKKGISSRKVPKKSRANSRYFSGPGIVNSGRRGAARRSRAEAKKRARMYIT